MIKPFYKHKNIIYIDKNINDDYKNKFINTCDAMLHGRKHGETFGLTIAEFSIQNKPIITCNCGDKEHILILKDKAIIYNNESELLNILQNIKMFIGKEKNWNAYSDFSPENVMKIFEKYL